MASLPALRPRALLVMAPLLVAQLGCGGGEGPKSASGAGAEGSKGATTNEDDSIGDLAVRKGGIAALGGAGNREGSTGIEAAMDAALHAFEVEKKSPVRVDGVLKEWPARTSANESLSGSSSGLALAVAVQYDDARLYVAGEIDDSALVRSSAHGDGDDRVTMTLAFPSTRGALKAYEIGFFAGKPGESVGAVTWLSGPSKGSPVTGAKIVESDTTGGYSFEASLPWTSFAEAKTTRVGLRAALRYHNGDGKKTVGVIGTGGGGVDQPLALAPLPTAPEEAVISGLLGPKGLAGTAPRIDVFADVAGDERKERVSVFGNFFTICGPGYRSGHQFFWREIAGELTSLETRELTGRGKEDMVVRRRITRGDVAHELLEIWAVPKGDEPATVFIQEVSIVDAKAGRRLTNAVRVSPSEIEVSVEPATGWDATSFREPTAGPEEGILLPWGAVKSRTFKLEKGKYAKTAEVAQPTSAATNVAAVTSPTPRDVPTPAVGKGGDLSQQVMSAYLRDQGVAAGTKPRFDLQVDVDGDARPERVALVGRDVVVLGPGFKGGNAYARMSLTQFADERDITELTARDITGDGTADLLVRGKRRVEPTAGAPPVVIDALFAYRVTGGAVTRIFSIETGREQGDKRVQGLVQFVPAKSGKGFDVDVRPGVARGWTDKTYPWPEEQPGGAIEPLLLPWGATKNLRYAWDGARYATTP